MEDLASKKTDNANPMPIANIFSWLSFWWLNPIFRKGYKRPLEYEDMFNVRPEDDAAVLTDKLTWLFNTESGQNRSSLPNAVCKMTWRAVAVSSLSAFFEEGLRICVALLVGQIVTYLSADSTTNSSEVWLYGSALPVCLFLIIQFNTIQFIKIQLAGMQLKVALSGMIYRKALRLSPLALSQTNTGEIVNLMSNDVRKIEMCLPLLPQTVVIPGMVAAVLYILWQYAGPYCLTGFIIFFILVPVQLVTSESLIKCRLKLAAITGRRVHLMDEILTGIRMIRMYCWEKLFSRLISDLRREELKVEWKRYQVLWAVNVPAIFSRHVYVILTVVGLVFMAGKPLTSSFLFTVLLMSGSIMKLISYSGPLTFQRLSTAYASIKRIQDFLSLEEKCDPSEQVEECGQTNQSENPVTDSATKGSTCHSPIIQLNKAETRWPSSGGDSMAINGVSLEMKQDESIAIIGAVGAGKTSLLLSILRECPLVSGKITTRGTLAYSSQEAWIFPGTLRQNIIFGQEFDEVKYASVVGICSLEKDFLLLPCGDLSLIGEKGVTLSGGQKARVSLARAIYSDADIYLLDDPFSAVDSAVGRHLFQECILKYLKNKIVLFVTHQLQYLSDVTDIVVMKEGVIAARGSYASLCSSGVDFTEMLNKDTSEEINESVGIINRFGDKIDVKEGMNESNFAELTNSYTQLPRSSTSNLVDRPKEERIEEHRSYGNLSGSVYKGYILAGGNYGTILLLFVVCLLGEVSLIMVDWSLSIWSNESDKNDQKFSARNKSFVIFGSKTVDNSSNRHQSMVQDSTNINIMIVCGILAAAIVLVFARAALFFKICLTASRSLHDKMYGVIARAELTFFDINPSGRILNRFSKDIGILDDFLPVQSFECLWLGLVCLLNYIFNCIIIPWLLLTAPPLFLALFYSRRYYVATSRDLKRMEGMTGSPMYSYLGATMVGIETIRACKIEPVLMDEFRRHQNLHTEAAFLYLVGGRWFGTRLDCLCVLYNTAVVAAAIFSKESLGLMSGSIGLALTYSYFLVSKFQWMVIQSAEVENLMTSAERVLEYCNIKSEAPLEKTKTKPPGEWPKEGSVTLSGATMRYNSNGPAALCNISLHIEPMEKIGIVGRTGAGKSSLLALLFRMREFTGTVLIDGVDISSIGLHDLRSKLSIIPQEPVLFNGSVRYNLDPMNLNSDDQIWAALDQVQMQSIIQCLDGQLDGVVDFRGNNFSTGQKQLLCLVRAVLARNKILIIDEATANVDARTDTLIQLTIKQHFQDCTVLTIAHRLHTVMNCDRIIVMGGGEVLEFDSPQHLLDSSDSELYRLARMTGPEEPERLKKMINPCL